MRAPVHVPKNKEQEIENEIQDHRYQWRQQQRNDDDVRDGSGPLVAGRRRGDPHAIGLVVRDRRRRRRHRRRLGRHLPGRRRNGADGGVEPVGVAAAAPRRREGVGQPQPRTGTGSAVPENSVQHRAIIPKDRPKYASNCPRLLCK